MSTPNTTPQRITRISSSSRLVVLLLLLVVCLGTNVVQAFYIPGVNPQSFSEGDKVKMKVNKMTSTQTQLPLNYYNFPFCQPTNGPEMENENLGEFLVGDRIQSSPYLLLMKKDMFCEHLCKSYLGRKEEKGMNPSKIVRAIRKNYHNNWIVDNLSSASKVESETSVVTKYSQGFPIGFIQKDTQKAYIHNHVNIEIMVHAVETEVNKYRIVRFTVEPFSIAHDADFEAIHNENYQYEGDSFLPPVAKIKNPIMSCDPSILQKDPQYHHTSYDMIVNIPQVANGDVLFTYDVIWIDNPDLNWGSRWDIYLSESERAKVHWDILLSLVVVVVLSAMVAAILVRNLRRDLQRYNKLATDEEKADELEEFGWKLVHGDVFRPPTKNPMLLAIFCGTGAQILGMSICIIIFSALGFLNPSQRGASIMGELKLSRWANNS